MSGPRVYIHELVDIIGHGRAEYMYHTTANWSPVGQVERDQRCFGVWAVVGSTGAWPQVVNVWEYDGWAALGRNFATELTGDGLQDPSLAAWWAGAADLRRGGFDRVLVAAEWSPSTRDLEASFRGAPAGYVHELVDCRPGTAADVLDQVRDAGVDAHASVGMRLVGAFATALGDEDECVLIWSFDRWDDWASAESGAGGGAALARWRAAQRDVVVRRRRMLLADAPLSPTRTGRQPSVADRREIGS